MPKCHRLFQMKQLGTSIASPQIGNSVQCKQQRTPKKNSSCCAIMIITEVGGGTGVKDTLDIKTGDETKLVHCAEAIDSQAGFKHICTMPILNVKTKNHISSCLIIYGSILLVWKQSRVKWDELFAGNAYSVSQLWWTYQH